MSVVPPAEGNNPPSLPPVSSPSPNPELWLQTPRPGTARSIGTHVRLEGSRVSSAVTGGTSIMDSLGRSMVSLNPFSSYQVSDLTNYSMTDQRWTLQRKKIGLKRRTKGTRQRQARNLQTRDINLAFIVSNFSRVECLRYCRKPDSLIPDQCYCGLFQEEHIPLTQLLRPTSRPKTSGKPFGFGMLTDVPEDGTELQSESYLEAVEQLLPIIEQKPAKRKSFFKRSNILSPMTEEQTTTISEQVQDMEDGLSNRKRSLDELIEAGSYLSSRRDHSWHQRTNLARSTYNDSQPAERFIITSPINHITAQCYVNISNQKTHKRLGLERQMYEWGGINDPNLQSNEPRIPPVDSEWSPATHYRYFPTNAYGKIEFVNELTGSSKPAKYVRIAKDTEMDSVMTLLRDYWRLLEPHRPQLVISVTGGAKNFKLDGKKKEIFTSGLIKAVKSTNAWLLTGGVNVGVMKSVGEAVNQGQYIVKVKRKNVFSEVKEHMVRGIRCLGVVPWGYVLNRENLINTDLTDFPTVKYKVQDKVKPHEPISLNGDHTHFLFIDDGSRNMFRGSDDFRTRLEEAFQASEPAGFGLPVVLLLLEGGISSISKCVMALKKRIPVVVVAGTGRGADLLAYAFSMTIRTPSGMYIMRKGHRAQLRARMNLAMSELSGNPEKQKGCIDMLVECCSKANMITIFDINSNEAMDKYILYALLKGGSGTTRIDQLNLALLWNRPDIAEQNIFPAQHEWPSGVLKDFMTTALLDEKVEFVNLLTINGLVMGDYLTVGTLRELYNKACEPNSHLARLLQRASHQHYHHLVHVHYVLQAMMKKHHDPIYRADTPDALYADTAINYLTFKDPYQELLLWAIFSNRGQLARYLWERCHSPLSTALVTSALYQSLWHSLGAKNTDIREVYRMQKDAFENLACELMDVCYQDDVINAMGLVERRFAKWGDVDCLELAHMANNLLFVSTACAQASIELNWRRGMIKAPFWAVILINFLPFLVFWKKLVRFQKLGDDGGELSPWQKMFVFYKSPISKFYASSSSFVCFLLTYSYVVLFDFKYEMSLAEKVVICWIFSFMIEEIAEVITQQSSTASGKFSDWIGSVWNRFDFLALLLASVALGLRLFKSTFRWGRIAYAVNTTIFYIRLFRIYHVNYHLGPKLIIFNRMIKEVLVFMALLVIFVLGYGIASQSLLHPTRQSDTLTVAKFGKILEDVLLTPYWQMYGELLLDELGGDNTQYCHQQSCNFPSSCLASNITKCLTNEYCVCESSENYTWVVSVLLFFYLIIGNIMLLNLLIAIFTYVFDEVQEHSMEFWKFEMYRLIREYDLKPGLVHPFVALEYAWRVGKKIWKLTCRKKKENLDVYMKDTLDTLRVFEKEAIMTYASNMAIAQEEKMENRVKRMSEKIDRIAKYIEQKEELEEIQEDLEWVIEEAANMKADAARDAPQSGKAARKSIVTNISSQAEESRTDPAIGARQSKMTPRIPTMPSLELFSQAALEDVIIKHENVETKKSDNPSQADFDHVKSKLETRRTDPGIGAHQSKKIEIPRRPTMHSIELFSQAALEDVIIKYENMETKKPETPSTTSIYTTSSASSHIKVEDQSFTPSDLDEVENLLKPEVSDDEIENELCHLQEAASSALGGMTPFKGSRTVTPYGRVSRPTTALRQRRVIDELSNRIDDIEGEIRSSRHHMENMMNTILRKLDENPSKSKSKSKKNI